MELVSEVVLRNNEVNVFEVVSQISARRLVINVNHISGHLDDCGTFTC